MADSQPWRNPRPAPQLSEMEGRVPTPNAWRWAKAWLPAVCWAALIFSMSTDSFSAEHTGRDTATDSVLADTESDRTRIRHDSFFCAQERALHRIFYILHAAFRGLRGGSAAGGAGRGRLRHCLLRRATQCWTRYTRLLWPAARRRRTIRCWIRLARRSRWWRC